jgi:vacuolar-type H+-ATPase subunit I/STV1
MVSCPHCSAAETSLLKSWPISFSREGEHESTPQFYIGIFECPNCNLRFRSRMESISNLNKAKSSPNQTSNIKEAVSRINEVKAGLTQTLRILRKRIGTLESERAGLLEEASELRKTAELRANTLEDEVHDLREELKSLKDLLGYK